MNEITFRSFVSSTSTAQKARPDDETWYGKGLGWETIHHAAGSMRMPCHPSHTRQHALFRDQNLRVVGSLSLDVRDMSVMPFSSAAIPRGRWPHWALRLSKHLA